MIDTRFKERDGNTRHGMYSGIACIAGITCIFCFANGILLGACKLKY